MASMDQRRPGNNHVKSNGLTSMKNAVPSHGCLTGAVDIVGERNKTADELQIVMFIEPDNGGRKADRCSA